MALGYEVVWSQSIVPFMSTRTYAFAVVLATYLGGLFLGSSLMAPRADRVRDPWGLFGLLIAGAGLLALLEMALLGRWLILAQTQVEALILSLGGSPLLGMSGRFAVAALCIVFVPTPCCWGRPSPWPCACAVTAVQWAATLAPCWPATPWAGSLAWPCAASC